MRKKKFLFFCLSLLLLLAGCNESGKKDENRAAEDIKSQMNEKVLVFTKTVGYRHESIEKGVTTLGELGEDNSFSIAHTENSADFNPENLRNYSLVIFLSTTMDVLNSAQEKAFESYIRQGGNFMGIHAATDTEYDWPWYGKLVGGYFKSHPEQQQAVIRVRDRIHPSTKHLGTSWSHFDEWYNFKNMNNRVNVLLELDESSYTGGENGDHHPIAWYHEYEGGRSFYTGLGHTEEAYDDLNFRKHLTGGILYCLGRN
jgi:type 1 glutamine amidotransferase